jgi:predicted aspartyl protease
MSGFIRTFDERRKWGQADNAFSVKEWLPLAMVIVHDVVEENYIPVMAIVDTGAQYLMLPADISEELGIDLSECDSELIIIASGQEIELPCTMVNITVRGNVARVLACFGDGWDQPLIGIESIYKTMVFGIDREGSLYGEPRKTGGLVCEVLQYLRQVWKWRD